MVFWILVWLLAGVLILVLSHFFGVKVFDTTNKIYAEFDPAREEVVDIEEVNEVNDENELNKGGKENV